MTTDDKSTRKNVTKTGPGNPPVEHRFKAGNPGRPKGSKNKLGEDFIAALHADFEEHGRAVIARVRQENPAAYMKVIASMMPKDFNVSVESRFDHMTEEDLNLAIDMLNASLYEETGDARFAPVIEAKRIEEDDDSGSVH